MIRRIGYYFLVVLTFLFIPSIHAKTSLNVPAEEHSNCVKLINSNASSLELEFSLGELSIEPDPTSGGDRYKISLDGESPGGAPGYPDLPSVSRLVAIPPQAGIALEWSGDAPRLLPNRTPVNTEALGEALSRDGREPAEHGLWPSDVVAVGDPVILRGVRMVEVSVHPVQFEASTGNLYIHDHIQVKLNFTAHGARNPVLDPARPRPSGSAIKLARSIVLNPQDIHRDQDEGQGSFVYVIPFFGGVAEAIQPLVDWRRRQGYPTQVITAANNASNVEIRNQLRDAYFNWDIPPEFVTLVGDGDLVNANFMIPAFDVGRAYMWETDYQYALLEGNDLIPEAAVGRISARSLAELRNVVAKIVGYETNPYLDDPGWFTRAALMANDPRTGYSSIYLQRWARKLLLEVGFAEVDTFYFIHENQVTGHQFVAQNINQGISLFNYRGWGQFNGDWIIGDVRELRNDRMLPLIILPTCNTGDFVDHILFSHAYSEDFLWAANGGAIGAIGASGFTHTNYNNVFDGGMLNSFYRDQIWELGWALNRGKMEMYRHFALFNDIQDPQVPSLLVWEAHAYQYNLIGDAGTELWTGVPYGVTVEHADEIATGENRFSVQVREAEGDNPVSDARVTLVCDGEILRKDYTDNGGWAHFSFIPGELQEGTMQLTVVKHDQVPYLTDIQVTAPQTYVGFSSLTIDDDRAGLSRGNSDGLASPGEILELRTNLTTFGGQAPQGAITCVLTKVIGDVDTLSGTAVLQQAPQPGNQSAVTFVVQVGQNNINGQRVLFHLQVSAGQNVWRSALEFPIAAADLEYARHSFTPNRFNPGDTTYVDVTLRNLGAIRSGIMHGTLISGREVVNVFDRRADFAAVGIEGNDSVATARFRIHAHTLTVPGTPIEMTLALTNDDGFADTARFSFTIGRAAPGTPFGPDAYGYVCFDDADTLWEGAPEFAWIEIAPDLGGQGTDTEIRDLGNEQDFSLLVDLPFNFRYYGQDFRQVTLCSNGWFAFGDESKLADFQNRRIPPALGPRAQVCVFWDDLVNYVGEEDQPIGGIYYWFDQDSGRFVIEWSRMRRYIGHDQDGNLRPGSVNTFQAILYDPQVYPTYTRDGDIQFQYLQVHNDRDVDPLEFDTPYATVGIVNLNGTDVIEYTYWNRYAAGASVLQNGRAILFSTKLIVVVGYAEGRVEDLATGEPLQNAEISGSKGSFARTRPDGSFFMDNVLIGADYSFTAWAPGYNEQTLEG
ncbi:MAG: C25 family cysteine peptidase, partial [Calditrichota bacterium]